MTRISKALIEGMQNKAVEKAGINKAKADLAARDEALTEAMRIAAMGGEDNYARLMLLDAKHKKLFAEAGSYAESDRKHLIVRKTSLRVNLAGITLRRYFHDSNGDHEARFSPDGQFVFEQGHPVVAEFYAIEDEKKALDDRRKLIRAQVAAAVSKVNTVKRLLEVWPEAAELIPETSEAAVVNFPAIRTEDLNKLIGLPSEAPAPTH